MSCRVCLFSYLVSLAFDLLVLTQSFVLNLCAFILDARGSTMWRPVQILVLYMYSFCLILYARLYKDVGKNMFIFTWYNIKPTNLYILMLFTLCMFIPYLILNTILSTIMLRKYCTSSNTKSLLVNLLICSCFLKHVIQALIVWEWQPNFCNKNIWEIII